MYDFDGTLAPGNMYDHSFFPELNINKEEFWEEVKATASAHDMDQILTYMQLLIEKLKEEKKSISRREFTEHGRHIRLFDGLEADGADLGWFKRINAYGQESDIGVDVEHYIISSGLQEMIDGTPIKEHFTRIFASKYKYSPDDTAEWPALAINYTTKTQYLFRINKGIPNSWNDDQINQFMPANERPIPFSHMIYIGDGDTDIPCMKMIRHQGGHSVAVYDPNPDVVEGKRKKCEDLVRHERADHATAADYRPGSALEDIVRKLVRKIAVEIDLKAISASASQ